jgi:hypothetical protein
MRASPKWVSTGGGPLILVPVEVALHWRGTDGIGPSSEVWESWGEDEFSGTDHGRACGVDDYLGVLGCGPGECLVLGDEPMQTTILPAKDGGLIVRWMCGNTHLVFSVPVSLGFPAVEALFNDLAGRFPGSSWLFGNVYDPWNDFNPRDCWE